MRTLRSLLVSMQRLLERARHHVALGALTVALGLLGVAATGCETDEEGKVYYGPAPIDDVADASADVPAEAVIYPDGVLYGPPPVDVVTDTNPVPDGVQPDQPVVYYGPQPTDVVQDAVPDAPPIEVAPLYGIQPVDVVQEVEPPDVKADCPPMAFYGPPPCSSDAECKADYGENWYCDTTNSYPDGCGGTMTYPQCKPKG